MIKINNLNNAAILVDFDGTITTEDTNVKLFKDFGNERTAKLRQQYKSGQIDLLTFVELEYKEIKITEEEYIDFILNQFDISKGFKEFYKNIKENNIPFAIVSGGFDNGIIPFLKKHGIDNVDIYANSFIFNDDDITVKFYDDIDLNCCDSGPCGNCKIRHYKNYKEKNNTVIFIGDGSTDKSVSEVADIVFAKDSLLDYCKEKDIECIPWDDFHDINKLIFNKVR